MIVRRTVVVATIVGLFALAAAHAQTPQSPVQSVEFQSAVPVTWGESRHGVAAIGFTVRYRLWVLLGEPVYSIDARWSFSGPGGLLTAMKSSNTAGDWLFIDRYPDLVRELESITPLDLELAASVSRDDILTNLNALDFVNVRFVVDLPAAAGQWSGNLTATSPDWEAWPVPLESRDSPRVKQLQGIFRSAIRDHHNLVLTSPSVLRMTWPSERIASIQTDMSSHP